MFELLEPPDEPLIAPVDDLDADATLDAAQRTQRRVNLAQVEQLMLAAHWADLNDLAAHPYLAAMPAKPSARAGREQIIRPGGEGTPGFAEFAPAELGAVVGVSVHAAASLVTDALDLRHRFPLLWAELQTGFVKVWVARKVAATTRRLSQTAAARVDAQVAPIAATVPFGRLEKIVDTAILRADSDRARIETHRAAGDQGVWVSRDTDHGHATLIGKAPAIDISAVDATLNTLARALTVLGDTDPHQLRRAKALGILADPTAALDLTRRADEAHAAQQTADDQSDRTDKEGRPADGTDPRRGCDLGRAVVYLHLTQADLDRTTGNSAAVGVARVAGAGPALLDQIRDWLGHRHVTIRPILDIPGLTAVDRYEVPTPIAAAIRHRTPADCFPYSANTTGNGDNEHTVPYTPIHDGGPPGQTRVDNLAWMNRRTHRIKTHGRWRVTQPRTGMWVWRSPHGHHFLVDENGTTPLGRLWTA